ncbi:hypothetical protein MRB53_040147 [Persea americana]|nr:hypothetical protein MRB53_040147 [Persea americana]
MAQTSSRLHCTEEVQYAVYHDIAIKALESRCAAADVEQSSSISPKVSSVLTLLLLQMKSLDLTSNSLSMTTIFGILVEKVCNILDHINDARKSHAPCACSPS